MKNNPKLVFKVILIILEMFLVGFSIYNMISTDYDFNNKFNLISIITLFVSLLFLIISCISNSNLSIGTMIITIIFLITSLVASFYKPKIAEQVIVNKNEKTCTKDTTTIYVKYNDSNIEQIKYTYIYTNKDDANNTVNHFDNKYKEIDNVYSEISYGNENIVTFNYIITDSNKDILEKKYTDYNLFKDEELKGFECK